MPKPVPFVPALLHGEVHHTPSRRVLLLALGYYIILILYYISASNKIVCKDCIPQMTVTAEQIISFRRRREAS